MGEHRDDHQHPAPDERTELSYFEKRTDAIQALLIENGIITADDVRRRIEALDARTPAQGARVVARAWVDPSFKLRLLANGKTAIAELGYGWASGVELAVVENSERVHHVVVCTLCSCYPKPLLGPPPAWYKSLAYRSRTVADPRAVLREFGLELDQRVQVRVLDSTADNRYLVLPVRPAGTEGMSEAELAELVTRDTMIGVSQPRTPVPSLKAR